MSSGATRMPNSKSYIGNTRLAHRRFRLARPAGTSRPSMFKL
jgi:hypothetical protein